MIFHCEFVLGGIKQYVTVERGMMIVTQFVHARIPYANMQWNTERFMLYFVVLLSMRLDGSASVCIQAQRYLYSHTY